MENNEELLELKMKSPVYEADVIVCGGGPAGMAAAYAAIHLGVKTLLIERYGFLGGMATSALVGPILGHRLSTEKPAVTGFLKILTEEMAILGGAPGWEESLKMGGIPFDVEIFKYVTERLITDSGVKLLLYSLLIDVEVENGFIKSVIVANKSGKQKINGQIFIDATGDGDLAFLSGAPYKKGRLADGKMQSMGTVFRVGGVKEEFLTKEVREKASQKLSRARDSGLLKIYNTQIGIKGSTIRKGELTFNITRFAGDGTDVEDLTRGELELRRETFKIVDFLRKNVPGFKDAYLISTPVQIGIRETRQIIGEYTLTAKDILLGRKYEDSIARGTWWIDIHCPLGRTKDNVHLCTRDCTTAEPCLMLKKHPDQLPQKNKLHPPKGDWYSIPYLCLLPRKINNLLVAGRPISATHQAMAGSRVMGTCMAIGQSAGIAAAQAFKKKILPKKLSVKNVQEGLISQNALF